MRIPILSLFFLLFVSSDCATVVPHNQVVSDVVMDLNADESRKFIQKKSFQKFVGTLRLTLDEPAIREYFSKPEFRRRVKALLKRGANITSDVVTLDLDHVNVADITLLAGFEKLKTLILTSIQGENIEPLAGLVNLRELFLTDLQVEDIEPLAKLVSLEHLSLSDAKVQDIKPLARLSNLEQLSLSDTKVQDITPLAQLAKLEFLSLSRSPVRNIETLAGLENLKLLSLSGPQVHNIASLARLVKLQIYLDGYPVKVAPHAETLTDLSEEKLREIGQRQCPICLDHTTNPPAGLLNTCGGKQTFHRDCLESLRDSEGADREKCPYCKTLLGDLPPQI